MTDDRFNSGVHTSLEQHTSNTEFDDQKVKEELTFLIRGLRDMPDREPPPGLVDKILRSVQSKRISLWRRFFLWAATPRSLTISPIKFIPAAVGVCVCLLLLSHFLPEQKLSINQGKEKLVSVIFTFKHPQASSVSLIGSFNQWSPRGFEMSSPGEEKVWLLELKLPQGRHEYAFLVNGEVVLSDPTSPFTESDGFGNQNSIIFVTNDYAKNI